MEWRIRDTRHGNRINKPTLRARRADYKVRSNAKTNLDRLARKLIAKVQRDVVGVWPRRIPSRICAATGERVACSGFERPDVSGRRSQIDNIDPIRTIVARHLDDAAVIIPKWTRQMVKVECMRKRDRQVSRSYHKIRRFERRIGCTVVIGSAITVIAYGLSITRPNRGRQRLVTNCTP